MVSTTALDAAALAAEEFGRAVDAIDEAAAAVFGVNRSVVPSSCRHRPRTT